MLNNETKIDYNVSVFAWFLKYKFKDAVRDWLVGSVFGTLFVRFVDPTPHSWLHDAAWGFGLTLVAVAIISCHWMMKLSFRLALMEMKELAREGEATAEGHRG